MSEARFQIAIVGPGPETGSSAEPSPFGVDQHSRGGAVVDRIDDLSRIWAQVIAKLTDLASQSSKAGPADEFELDEIEFNVGIEAGLSVGLVTKGDASVSVKFVRKKTAQENSSANKPAS